MLYLPTFLLFQRFWVRFWVHCFTFLLKPAPDKIGGVRSDEGREGDGLLASASTNTEAKKCDLILL
jgi:hypothetical protein